MDTLLDAADHRRSPPPCPAITADAPPRNKGEHYPADPPTIEEIIEVMRIAGDSPDGHRLRALIVILWRAGLRIGEALALQESDLDADRGAVLVRRGKGGKRREWTWTAGRGQSSPPGPKSDTSCQPARSCASSTAQPPGATGKHPQHASSCTMPLLQQVSADASRPTNSGTPTPSRWAHEGVPLVVIQRQLGHANLGITSIYLQGIDSAEIINTVHGRPSPMISASTGLQLK